MNGYNFTERVRKVLALASEVARKRHHEFVGTEHVLLGLLLDGEGVAAAVLQSLGADLSELRARVESRLHDGDPSPHLASDLPYTSRTIRVLDLAMAEARDLHHSYVGTEHVLLGLLREERGPAAAALKEAATSTAGVRAETLRFLGAGPEPGHQRSDDGDFMAIAIELRRDDGTTVREEFGSVVAAMQFLKRAAHARARRVAF